MGTIINLTNALSCFWLAICAMLFYIILYGTDNSMVHRWKFLQHWSLKLGLIGIIVGSVLNAVSWSHVGWTGALLNGGLALVFNWAYLYHKKLFSNQQSEAKVRKRIKELDSELNSLAKTGKKKYNTL